MRSDMGVTCCAIGLFWQIGKRRTTTVGAPNGADVSFAKDRNGFLGGVRHPISCCVALMESDARAKDPGCLTPRDQRLPCQEPNCNAGAELAYIIFPLPCRLP